MSEPVRFLLNGQRIDARGLSPQTTLLGSVIDEPPTQCEIGAAGVAIRGKHPGSIAIDAGILAVRETAARQPAPQLGKRRLRPRSRQASSTRSPDR